MTIALAAALVLGQDPNFGFPVSSFKPVNDRMVGMLGFGGTSRTRGFLLSSDATVVFAVDDDKVCINHLEDRYVSYARFFVHKDDPKSPLYTELQRRAEQGDSGKDSVWQAAEVVSLLRSETGKELTLAYNREGRLGGGVATVNLESDKVSDNKSLFIGSEKQRIYSAFPDVTADGALLDTILDEDDRAQRPFYALLDGKKLKDTRPGWAPMMYDSKGNHLICYLYGESGFPHGINLEPVVGESKDDKMGFPMECTIVMFAMLPDRRLIGYFSPRADAETMDKYAGTYIWDSAGQKWDKANGYELSGASADGRALLFSDRIYRKSWIVVPVTG